LARSVFAPLADPRPQHPSKRTPRLAAVASATGHNPPPALQKKAEEAIRLPRFSALLTKATSPYVVGALIRQIVEGDSWQLRYPRTRRGVVINQSINNPTFTRRIEEKASERRSGFSLEFFASSAWTKQPCF